MIFVVCSGPDGLGKAKQYLILIKPHQHLKRFFDFDLLTSFEYVDHDFHLLAFVKLGEIVECVIGFHIEVLDCHERLLKDLVLMTFEFVLPVRTHQTLLLHVLRNPFSNQLLPGLGLLARNCVARVLCLERGVYYDV
jgi:hypothetical protein